MLAETEGVKERVRLPESNRAGGGGGRERKRGVSRFGREESSHMDLCLSPWGLVTGERSQLWASQVLRGQLSEV